MDSAIAMRLTLQIFKAECWAQRQDDDSREELSALRNGLEDPALGGAAQPLVRLLFRLRPCNEPDIEIMLVFIRTLAAAVQVG